MKIALEIDIDDIQRLSRFAQKGHSHGQECFGSISSGC